MKKQILCAVIFGIIALFSCSFANAQTNSAMRTKVGFDFYVGDKKMTAGEYVVERISPSEKTVLSIRRADGEGETVMILTTPIWVARKSEVIFSFNRYGAVRYLAEIRNGYSEFGVKLRQHKNEIKLAREFKDSKREIVSVKSGNKQKAAKAVD